MSELRKTTKAVEKVPEFVQTAFGIAKVLGMTILGEYDGYRLRYTENSWCPGLISICYPKHLCKEIEE